MKTQITPATEEEIEAFKREHGITDLEHDPPGTETLTLGEFIDESLAVQRNRDSAKR